MTIFLLSTLKTPSYNVLQVVTNHKPRYCQERDRTQNSLQSRKGKCGLKKIIRFLHGIRVTQLRNLYAGNLHFDPDMQKMETLIGTIQTVI